MRIKNGQSLGRNIKQIDYEISPKGRVEETKQWQKETRGLDLINQGERGRGGEGVYPPLFEGSDGADYRGDKVRVEVSCRGLNIKKCCACKRNNVFVGGY